MTGRWTRLARRSLQQTERLVVLSLAVAGLLLLLVQHGLHAQLGGGAGGDVDGVLEAETLVVIGQKVTNRGIIPANYDGVGLDLRSNMIIYYNDNIYYIIFLYSYLLIWNNGLILLKSQVLGR